MNKTFGPVVEIHLPFAPPPHIQTAIDVLKVKFTLLRNDYLNFSYNAVNETARNDRHITELRDDISANKASVEKDRMSLVFAKKTRVFFLKGKSGADVKPTFDERFLERKNLDVLRYEEDKLQKELDEMERSLSYQGPASSSTSERDEGEAEVEADELTEEEIAIMNVVLQNMALKVYAARRMNTTYKTVKDFLRREEIVFANFFTRMDKLVQKQTHDMQVYKQQAFQARKVAANLKKNALAKERYMAGTRGIQDREGAEMHAKFSLRDEVGDMYETMNSTATTIFEQSLSEAAKVQRQRDAIRSKVVAYEDTLHRIMEVTTSNTVEEMLASFESQASLSDKLTNMVGKLNMRYHMLKSEVTQLYSSREEVGYSGGERENVVGIAKRKLKADLRGQKAQLYGYRWKLMRSRRMLHSCQDGARSIRDMLWDVEDDSLQPPKVPGAIRGVVPGESAPLVWKHCMDKLAVLVKDLKQEEKNNKDRVFRYDRDEFYVQQEELLDEEGPNIRTFLLLPREASSESNIGDFHTNNAERNQILTRQDIKNKSYKMVDYQMRLAKEIRKSQK